MPQRVSKRPRRVSFKRRPRRFLRKTRLTRPLRLKRTSTEVHHFKRSTCLFGMNGQVNTMIATSTGSSGGFYSVGFNNMLTQVPEYTEFTNLYDQYKIDYIVYKITWLGTDVTSVSTTLAGAPVLYWVLDRDDVSAFAGSDAGIQYMRANSHCRRYTFDSGKREVTIKFKPNTLVETYNNGVTSGYTLQFNKWIDCANDGLQYFGTKFLFHTPSPNGAPTVANYFEVIGTYYLSFRNPR